VEEYDRPGPQRNVLQPTADRPLLAAELLRPVVLSLACRVAFGTPAGPELYHELIDAYARLHECPAPRTPPLMLSRGESASRGAEPPSRPMTT
jgi:hypothetical protein